MDLKNGICHAGNMLLNSKSVKRIYFVPVDLTILISSAKIRSHWLDAIMMPTYQQPTIRRGFYKLGPTISDFTPRSIANFSR